MIKAEASDCGSVAYSNVQLPIDIESGVRAFSAGNLTLDSYIDPNVNSFGVEQPYPAVPNTINAFRVVLDVSTATDWFNNEPEFNAFDEIDHEYWAVMGDPDFIDFKENLLEQLKPETEDMLKFMNEL
jgi:hypothetical protein